MDSDLDGAAHRVSLRLAGVSLLGAGLDCSRL